MSEREFCFWLKGFLDILHPSTLSVGHIGVIEKKLGDVLADERNKAAT
jgi:hypothetical protein